MGLALTLTIKCQSIVEIRAKPPLKLMSFDFNVGNLQALLQSLFEWF